MECKHAPKPICDETCECWCDACQTAYETAWDARVKEESLCPGCGVPLGNYTLEQLLKHQYDHFFIPCQTCEAPLKAFMEKAGLCYVCRTALEDGACAKCKTSTVHTFRKNVAAAEAAEAAPPAVAEEQAPPPSAVPEEPPQPPSPPQ